MHGGMLWFEVKGGVQNGVRLMDTVRRPWTLAENLGACESIITCPAVMTHANMLKEDRLKVGITDGFVRNLSSLTYLSLQIRLLFILVSNHRFETFYFNRKKICGCVGFDLLSV